GGTVPQAGSGGNRGVEIEVARVVVGGDDEIRSAVAVDVAELQVAGHVVLAALLLVGDVFPGACRERGDQRSAEADAAVFRGGQENLQSGVAELVRIEF